MAKVKAGDISRVINNLAKDIEKMGKKFEDTSTKSYQKVMTGALEQVKRGYQGWPGSRTGELKNHFALIKDSKNHWIVQNTGYHKTLTNIYEKGFVHWKSKKKIRGNSAYASARSKARTDLIGDLTKVANGLKL